MSLVIKRGFNSYRKISLLAVWFLGLGLVVSAPLSQAHTQIAHSPSAVKHTESRTSSKKVSKAATSKHQKKVSKNSIPAASANPASSIQQKECNTTMSTHNNLSSSFLSQLRRLQSYETVCQSAVTGTLSLFAPFPTSPSDASSKAADMSRALREFAKYNITPVIFLEPTNGTGQVELAQIKKGKYDVALDTYFSKLKEYGISDKEMGTWVPLPEGNIPVWSSVDPAIFGGSVTKIVTSLKKQFPTASTSILLDNLTYPSADSWAGGRPSSLVPYLRHIPKGLLSSVGLQGFPWSPPANTSDVSNGEPTNYLRAELLMEAARYAGTQNVWLNTGTFSTAYAGRASQQVSVSPEQRHKLLDGVVQQATTIKSKGFTVAVHLFAENKSLTSEGIDWSYWGKGQAATSKHTIVFKNFMNNLTAKDIPLWLFDTE